MRNMSFMDRNKPFNIVTVECSVEIVLNKCVLVTYSWLA